MKIATITFHCSYNYGSALQTYALQKYLEMKGHNVKIIDFVLESDFEHYKLFRTKLYKDNFKYIIADILYLNKNIRRKKSFERFSKKHLKLTDKRYTTHSDMNDLNKEFDAFICGSDQIWNLDCTNGIVPAFFLDFVDDSKIKFSYAPSIARLKFDNAGLEGLSKYLDRLDFISVREKSTIPMLKKITNKEVTDVIDPTMLLLSDDYKEIMENTEVDGKYIFLYFIEINKKIIEYSNKLSEEKNLKIVYFTKRKILSIKNGINAYGISPEKWLSLIKNSEYVVTNSFHATVFSILFKKKFTTFAPVDSYSRVTDLLEKLDLDSRIHKNESSLSEIDNDIDYENAFSKLNKLKEDAEQYLAKALNRK